MSQKKLVRERFRLAVFERDKYQCVVCGVAGTAETLDAHHITDRNEMPNGGYVAENGISLCASCHELAEQYHNTGTAAPGMAPDDLYQKIGSSYPKAVKASEAL